LEKILIVDDISANRMLLSKMLSSLRDCKIIEASDGMEAITKFKEEQPDLILMDINMPDMNGYESAASIKKLTADSYVPVIFITALSTEASLSKSLESGGDDFISKPFDAEVLNAKIMAHFRIRSRYLNLKEKNQELQKCNIQLEYEQELIEHFFETALKQSYLDEKIIKYHMSSMATFNGDLFLVERSPNGGLHVVMGDFTGHGLTAAMGTLPVAMIFFKMVNGGFSINETAIELNNQLHKLMPASMFFAATLIELNPECDKISVWMGSMPECYILGTNGEIKATLHSKNLPLGVLGAKSFTPEIVDYNVSKGDKIYLCSDGIVEAHNSDDEMFGNERLENILVSHSENRFDAIIEELDKFTGSNNQTDDITLVEITCDVIPAPEK
jgi:CheY-like chemotaxis protein